MNGLTRCFLVLLRLAIGWHFLVEGVEKIQSVVTGPTETSRPWTGEPYLREASGPLAEFFRGQFGDPDAEARARLTVKPGNRLSPKLEQDWQAYFDRFVAHHQLDENQQAQAQAKLEEAQAQAVRWLQGEAGAQDVPKSFPSGTVVTKQAPPERIREYEAQVERLREIEGGGLPAFERDVMKQKLRSLKADVARARASLLHDLNQPMKEALQSVLTDAQRKLPMPEQVTPHWWQWTAKDWLHWTAAWGLLVTGAVLMLSLLGQIAGTQAHEAHRAGWVGWLLTPLLVALLAGGLSLLLARIVRPDSNSPVQVTADGLLLWGAAAFGGCLVLSLLVRSLCALAGATWWGWGRWLLAWLLAGVGAALFLGTTWYVERSWADWSRQQWLDWLVTFGLTAVGVCLLLGFLSRPAALAGAGLLLMFYLTMPPLPGVPDNPRAEGHYLFVNKNLIEGLALLVLATLPTGRWLGLDGLFSALNPVRWFVKPPPPR